MNKQRKKLPVLKNIALDVLLTAVALVVFALFHHVLPRSGESLNITISNPYAAAQAEQPSTEEEISSESPEIEAAISYQPTVYTGQGYSSSATSSKRGKNNVPSSKGGSSIGSESQIEEDLTPISQKFLDKYTDTVVVTDSAYTSPDISISVSEQTINNGRITYYIADIYLRDITCFQTALAENTYGSGYRDSISDMALLNKALVAVNGDYYGNTTEGVVIRNGVIYRANPTSNDVCVLYYDGSMRIIPGSSFSIEDAINDGAWQAWTFGPALLDASGNTISSFNSSARIISANPRTAIGYYEPGHYCLIVVDGRGDSAGITLPEMSRLFYNLGCKAAYNLDGGNSSIMVWQDEIINEPSGGGRESSDALLIAEVRTYA